MNKSQWPESAFLRRHMCGATFLFVVILLISTIVYSAISWMWDEHRLPLSKLVLQGNLQYVTATDVQKALSHLDHVGTFMSQNIDDLQKVVKTIPWVEHAAIRKQWPNTIKVFLTEHQVQAIWNGNALLDEHGTVFDGDIGLVKGEHVKLYGPENSAPEVLDAWKKYNPEFLKLGLNITSLLLNERRAWQIILNNGIRLELGQDSVDERIARFIKLYRYFGEKVDKISYVDLRYDTGAAVGWFQDQELEQESTNDKNDR
ncbi:cell division protein FtsQ/DivIB [Vibrio viridaestus]|uniref:Cell division protein FtsQ n=1 Tax=Vibrio viridaestus TaxID=2487322 RepID=A0A3N9TG29_9VIBR|nr:cell division protein FtsQ/DivIB [Vibrio viridaestus]RQW63099.1 FtsQ-type POTRA domain-containing protein [Vibrio viridaestus]